MRYRAFAAVIVAMCMLTGCEDGGASSATTSATTASSAVEAAQDDSFFRELYADDLYNKYNQYLNDSQAFDEVYYVEDVEDMDVDAVIAAAEKCISTFEAIIAIEPPASLSEEHQKVIEGAQYEIRLYDCVITACLYSKGEKELTDQEMEDINAFVVEYTERETFLFSDAFLAAIESAAGY